MSVRFSFLLCLSALPGAALDGGTALKGPFALPPADCRQKAACLCPWKGAQDFATFKRIAPYSSQDALLCANYSNCSWQLAEGAQKVFHSRGDYRRDPLPVQQRSEATRNTIEVQNGWLSALNAGEWGARLEFHRADAGAPQLVSQTPVSAFARIGVRVFAATGLDHLARGSGSIVELFGSPDGGWQQRTLARFEGAAHALTPSQGELLTVTASQLLRVSLDGGVRVLARNEGWSMITPHQIVEGSDGTLLLPARFAVIELTPRDGGYSELWRVPPACVQTVKKDLECRCVARP